MNYQRFLPFDDYRLYTLLSDTEVRNRIADSIEANKKVPFFSIKNSNTKPYKGRLTKEGFEISRLIEYRNSFLPQISGQILPAVVGTTIRISARPHLFVLIFMSFWLSIVGLFCLGILFSLLTQLGHIGRDGFSLPLLIPFGMFAVGCGMLIGGYRVESNKSKAFLLQLLNAKEIMNP